MLKRASGSGTVYKLPGRRRRPWVARITTGWKKVTAKRGKYAGKEVSRQTYQTIGYFERKQDALDALVLHRINPISSKQNITLGELYKDWSATRYPKLSKKTAGSYKMAWNYISHHQKEKFKSLRTSHWQTIVDRVFAEGYSKSLLTKIRSLLVQLSEHAMKDDVIDKNYAKLLDMPKFEKKERTRFTDIEVKKIEDAAAKKVPWADTVLMMIYTGFRISEFLSLTRFNVDMESGVITGGAKSEAGKNRPVPINPKIIGYVKKWLDKKGETLVCQNNGKKWTNKQYRIECFYPALKAAGVRKLRPHDCRHTFATMLAEAGVDPLYIKLLLGHTQYSFTADTYTHPDVKKLIEAIKKL